MNYYPLLTAGQYFILFKEEVRWDNWTFGSHPGLSQLCWD
jgi:hypothetical protein